jgi:hypothetical protein
MAEFRSPFVPGLPRPLSEFARKPMPKAPSASESLDALKKGSP